MKIPNSVRIGGVEYPVVYASNVRDGATVLYGQIDFDGCVITLSTSERMEHQRECITLWHEILHGIVNHAGMEIKNEEDVVAMFAKGIYQVLQDNGARLFGIKEVEDGTK